MSKAGTRIQANKNRTKDSTGSAAILAVAAGATNIGPPGSGATNEGTSFKLATQGGAVNVLVVPSISGQRIWVTQEAGNANVTSLQQILGGAEPYPSTIATLTPTATLPSSVQLVFTSAGIWEVELYGQGAS